MKPLYVKKNGVVYKISGNGMPALYPAENVEYDNTVTSELQATDVQGAIDELSTREAGVQSDWNENDTAELDYIKNKPQNLVQDASYVHTDNNYDATAKGKVDNLGTAASKNVPTSGNANTTQVVMGDDTRLTDARSASDVSAWAKASTKPTYTASEVGAIASTLKGAVNGVAELDAAGKVPSSQLPSFVDDVIEVADYDHLPITGESGKIYVTLDTNKTYRWTGSGYAEISESLALGETSSTAYRGDRGKTAYDHSQDTGRITTAVSSGLYKFSATAQGHISGTTAVQKSDITALGIPAQDTTYGVVSKTANGLAPQLPNETTTTKYLRQDGTWQVPPDTDTIYSAGNGLTLTGTSFNVGKRWNAVTQGQKWSRLYLATPVNSVEGTSGILAVSCTRGSTVCNATFLITTSHAGATYSNTIELASCNYTQVRSRIVVNSNGLYYFEIYDDKSSIAAGTTQIWHCCFIPLLDTTLTVYTSFTDGTTVPSGYTAGNDFTTTAGNTASAIKNISRSGTTFTATRQDGTTFTFTQQDSTYNFAGTTFYSGNSGSAEHNANSIQYNGVYYYSSNGPSTVQGASTADGALYAEAHSTTWVGQIAQDYRNGNLWVRGKNNGTLQYWKGVVTDDILLSLVPTANKFLFNPIDRKIIANKSTSAWDAQVYSKNGYATNCQVAFKPAQTNMAIMFGLDNSPAADANYNTIDYCWYTQNNGGLSIYENGTSISAGSGHTTYATGDDLRIEYANGVVKYYHNGVCCRSVARAISGKLYVDSSFHGASGAVYDFYFGPTTIDASSVNGLTLSLVT